MTDSLKTVVNFRSKDFDVPGSSKHFIDPACFGGDAARWLIEQFVKRGYDVTEQPNQEHIGWSLTVKIDGCEYRLAVAYRTAKEAGKEGKWVITVQRSTNILGAILGAGNRGITRQALEVLHKILSESAAISEIAWYDRKCFEKGKEENRASQP